MITKIHINDSEIASRMACNTEKKDKLTINIPNENILLLFGGNGVGKSTLMGKLKKPKRFDFIRAKYEEALNDFLSDVEFDGEKHDVIYFDCITDGVREKGYKQNINTHKEIGLLFDSYRSSHGESLIDQVNEFLVENRDRIMEKDTRLTVVIDEVDSGLDLYNLDTIFSVVRHVANQNKNIQFIISTNSYHLIHLHGYGFNMHTMELVRIKDYNEYHRIVSNSMRKLNTIRYGNE